MIEELEKEFYALIQEVETLRGKKVLTKEDRIIIHNKEKALLKLEEDMECIFTVEGCSEDE